MEAHSTLQNPLGGFFWRMFVNARFLVFEVLGYVRAWGGLGECNAYFSRRLAI